MAEICPDCGAEWPARLGRHGCPYQRRHVHNDALVFNPHENFLELITVSAARFYNETARAAESADLAGEGSPYPRALGEIDASIGYLKRYRQELQALAQHAHVWDENDYCTVCGADGRA